MELLESQLRKAILTGLVITAVMVGITIVIIYV